MQWDTPGHQFLPSEICRLVLGFLKEGGYSNTYRCFLKECVHLREYDSLLRKGQEYPTNIMGLSLLMMLEEYVKLKLMQRGVNTSAPVLPPTSKHAPNSSSPQRSQTGQSMRTLNQSVRTRVLQRAQKGLLSRAFAQSTTERISTKKTVDDLSTNNAAASLVEGSGSSEDSDVEVDVGDTQQEAEALCTSTPAGRGARWSVPSILNLERTPALCVSSNVSSTSGFLSDAMSLQATSRQSESHVSNLACRMEGGRGTSKSSGEVEQTGGGHAASPREASSHGQLFQDEVSTSGAGAREFRTFALSRTSVARCTIVPPSSAPSLSCEQQSSSQLGSTSTSDSVPSSSRGAQKDARGHQFLSSEAVSKRRKKPPQRRSETQSEAATTGGSEPIPLTKMLNSSRFVKTLADNINYCLYDSHKHTRTPAQSSTSSTSSAARHDDDDDTGTAADGAPDSQPVPSTTTAATTAAGVVGATTHDSNNSLEEEFAFLNKDMTRGTVSNIASMASSDPIFNELFHIFSTDHEEFLRIHSGKGIPAEKDKGTDVRDGLHTPPPHSGVESDFTTATAGFSAPLPISSSSQQPSSSSGSGSASVPGSRPVTLSFSTECIDLNSMAGFPNICDLSEDHQGTAASSNDQRVSPSASDLHSSGAEKQGGISQPGSSSEGSDQQGQKDMAGATFSERTDSLKDTALLCDKTTEPSGSEPIVHRDVQRTSQPVSLEVGGDVSAVEKVKQKSSAHTILHNLLLSSEDTFSKMEAEVLKTSSLPYTQREAENIEQCEQYQEVEPDNVCDNAPVLVDGDDAQNQAGERLEESSVPADAIQTLEQQKSFSAGLHLVESSCEVGNEAVLHFSRVRNEPEDPSFSPDEIDSNKPVMIPKSQEYGAASSTRSVERSESQTTMTDHNTGATYMAGRPSIHSEHSYSFADRGAPVQPGNLETWEESTATTIYSCPTTPDVSDSVPISPQKSRWGRLAMAAPSEDGSNDAQPVFFDGTRGGATVLGDVPGFRQLSTIPRVPFALPYVQASVTNLCSATSQTLTVIAEALPGAAQTSRSCAGPSAVLEPVGNAAGKEQSQLVFGEPKVLSGISQKMEFSQHSDRLSQSKSDQDFQVVAVELPQRTDRHAQCQSNQDSQTVGVVPVPSNQDSQTVGVVPVPSNQDSQTVGVVPVPSNQDSQTVGVVPVLSNQDSQTVGVVPVTSNQDSQTVAVVPVTSNQDSQTASVVPVPSNQDSQTVAVVPVPSNQDSQTVGVVPVTSNQDSQTVAVVPVSREESGALVAEQPAVLVTSQSSEAVSCTLGLTLITPQDLTVSCCEASSSLAPVQALPVSEGLNSCPHPVQIFASASQTVMNSRPSSVRASVMSKPEQGIEELQESENNPQRTNVKSSLPVKGPRSPLSEVSPQGRAQNSSREACFISSDVVSPSVSSLSPVKTGQSCTAPTVIFSSPLKSCVTVSDRHCVPLNSEATVLSNSCVALSSTTVHRAPLMSLSLSHQSAQELHLTRSDSEASISTFRKSSENSPSSSPAKPLSPVKEASTHPKALSESSSCVKYLCKASTSVSADKTSDLPCSHDCLPLSVSHVDSTPRKEDGTPLNVCDKLDSTPCSKSARDVTKLGSISQKQEHLKQKRENLLKKHRLFTADESHGQTSEHSKSPDPVCEQTDEQKAQSGTSVDHQAAQSSTCIDQSSQQTRGDGSDKYLNTDQNKRVEEPNTAEKDHSDSCQHTGENGKVGGPNPVQPPHTPPRPRASVPIRYHNVFQTPPRVRMGTPRQGTPRTPRRSLPGTPGDYYGHTPPCSVRGTPIYSPIKSPFSPGTAAAVISMFSPRRKKILSDPIPEEVYDELSRHSDSNISDARSVSRPGSAGNPEQAEEHIQAGLGSAASRETVRPDADDLVAAASAEHETAPSSGRLRECPFQDVVRGDEQMSARSSGFSGHFHSNPSAPCKEPAGSAKVQPTVGSCSDSGGESSHCAVPKQNVAKRALQELFEVGDSDGAHISSSSPHTSSSGLNHFRIVGRVEMRTVPPHPLITQTIVAEQGHGKLISLGEMMEATVDSSRHSASVFSTHLTVKPLDQGADGSGKSAGKSKGSESAGKPAGSENAEGSESEGKSEESESEEKSEESESEEKSEISRDTAKRGRGDGKDTLPGDVFVSHGVSEEACKTNISLPILPFAVAQFLNNQIETGELEVPLDLTNDLTLLKTPGTSPEKRTPKKPTPRKSPRKSSVSQLSAQIGQFASLSRDKSKGHKKADSKKCPTSKKLENQREKPRGDSKGKQRRHFASVSEQHSPKHGVEVEPSVEEETTQSESSSGKARIPRSASIKALLTLSESASKKAPASPSKTVSQKSQSENASKKAPANQSKTVSQKPLSGSASKKALVSPSKTVSQKASVTACKPAMEKPTKRVQKKKVKRKADPLNSCENDNFSIHSCSASESDSASSATEVGMAAAHTEVESVSSDDDVPLIEIARKMHQKKAPSISSPDIPLKSAVINSIAEESLHSDKAVMPTGDRERSDKAAMPTGDGERNSEDRQQTRKIAISTEESRRSGQAEITTEGMSLVKTPENQIPVSRKPSSLKLSTRYLPLKKRPIAKKNLSLLRSEFDSGDETDKKRTTVDAAAKTKTAPDVLDAEACGKESHSGSSSVEVDVCEVSEENMDTSENEESPTLQSIRLRQAIMSARKLASNRKRLEQSKAGRSPKVSLSARDRKESVPSTASKSNERPCSKQRKAKKSKLKKRAEAATAVSVAPETVSAKPDENATTSKPGSRRPRKLVVLPKHSGSATSGPQQTHAPWSTKGSAEPRSVSPSAPCGADWTAAHTPNDDTQTTETQEKEKGETEEDEKKEEGEGGDWPSRIRRTATQRFSSQRLGASNPTAPTGGSHPPSSPRPPPPTFPASVEGGRLKQASAGLTQSPQARPPQPSPFQQRRPSTPPLLLKCLQGSSLLPPSLIPPGPIHLCPSLLCPIHLCPSHLCPSHLCPSLLCPIHLCPSHLCPSHLCPSLLCPSHLCPSHLCPSLLCPSLLCTSHLCPSLL